MHAAAAVVVATVTTWLAWLSTTTARPMLRVKVAGDTGQQLFVTRTDGAWLSIAAQSVASVLRRTSCGHRTIQLGLCRRRLGRGYACLSNRLNTTTPLVDTHVGLLPEHDGLYRLIAYAAAPLGLSRMCAVSSAFRILTVGSLCPHAFASRCQLQDVRITTTSLTTTSSLTSSTKSLTSSSSSSTKQIVVTWQPPRTSGRFTRFLALLLVPANSTVPCHRVVVEESAAVATLPLPLLQDGHSFYVNIVRYANRLAKFIRYGRLVYRSHPFSITSSSSTTTTSSAPTIDDIAPIVLHSSVTTRRLINSPPADDETATDDGYFTPDADLPTAADSEPLSPRQKSPDSLDLAGAFDDDMYVDAHCIQCLDHQTPPLTPKRRQPVNVHEMNEEYNELAVERLYQCLLEQQKAQPLSAVSQTRGLGDIVSLSQPQTPFFASPIASHPQPSPSVIRRAFDVVRSISLNGHDYIPNAITSMLDSISRRPSLSNELQSLKNSDESE